HGGTLLAVLVYFWKDIGDIFGDLWSSLKELAAKSSGGTPAVEPPHRGIWVCILITLIPTGIMAVCFKHFFETAFSNLAFVAAAWFVMGLLLVLSERFQKGQKDLGALHYGDAFWIGLVQGIALMPGISRSGSTILAGLMLGFRKETAAKFSFLISIPAVLAAIVMELRHGADFFTAYPKEVWTGFLCAAVVGYLVICWLMNLVRKGRFYLFGYYCIAISLFAVTYLILS
ncbi:MAG TPA: undecaprenyl-diphosphate phosphatase, partial [Candidatus Omnitrophota bacterium]|nr:undecaprenyl-diphosphate phosphatase [Candidatus Omnitrophota bacterium]